ncbi:hypothetical protein BX661DRAFT_200733 [Kickxella alabastrina]|uniref:uncharacterized protein n=1 Tax=Kickxella alabastrina TaxID=61397 RepID=UPI00221EC89D|nr:uncharacterized protein BX661DRAFT_200733 [Kickxella alabastrina]KAI7821264.1 hypothetical protein BX661DRAFT_200733 [Kickxella alabastrina]
MPFKLSAAQSAVVCMALALSGSLQPATKASAEAATGACAAQHIVERCLSTQGLVFDQCEYSDWACKCQVQTALVSCYNNCPDDQGRIGPEAQVALYCNAATRVQEAKSAASSTKLSVTASPAGSSRPEQTATAARRSTIGILPDHATGAAQNAKPSLAVPASGNNNGKAGKPEAPKATKAPSSVENTAGSAAKSGSTAAAVAVAAAWIMVA